MRQGQERARAKKRQEHRGRAEYRLIKLTLYSSYYYVYFLNNFSVETVKGWRDNYLS